MTVRGLVVAALLALGCQPLVAQNDPGRKAFEQCLACHSLEPDASGLPGPSLAGLAGRPVGGDPGFDYSAQLRAANADGLVWSERRLEQFLAAPNDMFPGTWMSDPGIRDPGERAALARYIATLGKPSSPRR